MEQKRLGQYFTTNENLKEIIYKFIRNKPNEILEPCIGKGHLIEYVQQMTPEIKFDMYEIDSRISVFEKVKENKNNSLKICDFLKEEIQKDYLTIIGNPPYIKKQKGGNVYIDFISKCVNLLKSNGELIFVVPSDFFKLTSASKLLNNMMENGTFTHIYHPHSERLFKEARIDVLVFRYCKNKNLSNKCLYNGKTLYIDNNNGLITFRNDNKKIEMVSFSDIFNVYVGIVSGRDSIYKNKELGNIDVLISKNRTEKYICITKFPSDDSKIDEYLLKNKEELLERKIRKFNEKNWFEWGCLRNIKQMKEDENIKECIYVHSLTRNEKIAFKDKIMCFGGQLIMLKPKEKINLENVIEYLNSIEFKQNFVFSGRFKIGQRQLLNCKIPRNIL